MLSLIHIANRRVHPGVFPQIFLDELAKIGSLKIVEEGRALSDEEKAALLRQADVALTGWNSCPLPPAIAEDPGRLKYVCHITGEMSSIVPREIIESEILVSNWGDSPAFVIAEGTMTLLLSVLKDLHRQILTIREGGWALSGKEYGGTLDDASLGLYGCGAIGRRFVRLVQPFNPRIRVFDPYCAELPQGCERAETLQDLFENSQILCVFAGLNEETRESVTAELLALLPRDGVVINTARGGILDQDALFAELESGRLRAGLDVLEPDSLPEDHPARTWRNCILTAHAISRGWPNHGKPPTRLSAMHRVCLENLITFSQGKPIKFEMDAERFQLST